MFGLPQQSIEQATSDILTACEFGVPHISHYQLTIEENTFFYKHTPALPESDLIWEMQTQCQNVLTEKNYQQYEISAYSQADKNSQHNLNYWSFGDYIGIGAGAHGKITEQDSSGLLHINRRWKHRQPQQYIKNTLDNNALSGTQQLDQKDIVFEFLLNALRLKGGSDAKTFKNNTGLDFEILKQATRNISPDLLSIDRECITTTDKGFLFLNKILEDLLEE